MRVDHESSLSKEVVQGLIDRGHVTKDMGGKGSVVGAVERTNEGKLRAKADSGKSGGVDGF